MSYWEKECPRDSYDAYREGRSSRSWENNPYDHGRYDSYGQPCRDAYEEWERGHGAAERERREEREAEEAAERRAYERHQEEMMEQAYYEQEQPYPEPPSYPEPQEPELPIAGSAQ